MISKVVVFEDRAKDQELFREGLEQAGCEVLLVGTHRAEEHRDEILAFGPHAAVVDSRFSQSDIDGTGVVKFLQNRLPTIPIVVCSILFDQQGQRKRLLRTYDGVSGVREIIGKVPFPTGYYLLEILGEPASV